MVTPSGSRPAMSWAVQSISWRRSRLGQLRDLGRQPEHDDPVHAGGDAGLDLPAHRRAVQLLLGIEQRVETAWMPGNGARSSAQATAAS